MGILIKVKGDCCALLTNVYKIRETCRDFFGVFFLFPHISHLRKKETNLLLPATVLGSPKMEKSVPK